jgi:hypothetical protein
MQDYQERVIEEHLELMNKIRALNKFLASSPQIPIPDLELLNQQRRVMSEYAGILEARIHRFV